MDSRRGYPVEILRESVSADDVPVARRALKAFVARVVARGDEGR